MVARKKQILAIVLVLFMLAGTFPADWSWLETMPGISAFAIATEDSQIVMLAAGENHTMALLDDGSVWAWGENEYGQVGDGTIYDRALPVQVISSDGFLIQGARASVTSIAAGANHSLAVLSDGRVLAWGNNRNGQLGDSTTANRTKPVPVMLSGNQYFTTTPWGSDEQPNISAGFAHTMAINAEGFLYGWGFNNYGQLGTRNNSNRLNPTLVILEVDVDEDTGAVTPVDQQPLCDLVAAGYNHTLAYAGGEVYAFGCNLSGQLGLEDYVNRNKPQIIESATMPDALRAGAGHSFILSNGDLYGFGSNQFGQIIVGDDTPSFTLPEFMMSGVADVQAGYNHNVILMGDYTVLTTGFNARGQIGNGSIELNAASYSITMNDPLYEPITDLDDPDFGAGPEQVPLFATKVVAGYYFSGLLDEADGNLWLWGDNGSGQLGDGTQQRRSKPSFLPIKVFYEKVVPVSQIVIDKQVLTIGLGLANSKTLTATIRPANVLFSKVDWTSSNPDVVTIVPYEPTEEELEAAQERGEPESLYPQSSVRLIGNKKAGTAIITATSYNNKSVSCEVTVRPDPQSIEITSYPRRMMSINSGYRLAAVISGNKTYDKTIEWAFADDLWGHADPLEPDEEKNFEELSTGSYINYETGILTAGGTSGIIYVMARSKQDPEIRTVVEIEVGRYADKVLLFDEEYIEDSGMVPLKTVTLYIDQREAEHVYQNMQLYPVSFPDTAKQAWTWRSTIVSVVDVDQDGVIYARKPGRAVVVCTSADGAGKSVSLEVLVKPLGSEIVITKPASIIGDTLTIRVGQRVTFATRVEPFKSNQNVVWSLMDNSDNPCAMITTRGVLTGLQEGETTAVVSTVELESSGFYPIEREIRIIVVNPVYKVVITPKTMTMMVGEEYQMEAFITPETATIKELTWTSSNEAAISVDDEGLLTARGPGKSKITATAKDGSGKKATATISVMNAPDSIGLNYYTYPKLLMGKVLKMKATVYPLSASQTVRWFMETEEGSGLIATISETGSVKGMGNGIVRVWAETLDGEIASEECYITCEVPVKTFSIKPTSVTVTQDTEVSIAVNIEPYNAARPGITLATPYEGIDFDTDGDGFITIQNGAMILSVDSSAAPGGPYTLKFNCDSKVATLKITVKEPPDGVEFTSLPVDNYIWKGKTFQLQAKVSPDYADQSITWVSMNEDVVTIDAKGKMKGTGSGETTIIAYAKGDPGYYAEETITCEVPVTGVKLSKTGTINMIAGAPVEEVVVTINPDGAFNALEWEVTTRLDGDVVYVDRPNNTADYFTLEAYGPGTDTVTVTHLESGKSASFKVVVKTNPTGVYITNEPRTDVLLKGRQLTLRAVVEDSTALQTVKWVSEDTKVARVTTKGVVTVVGQGTASIYCYVETLEGVIESDPYVFETLVPVTGLRAVTSNKLTLTADGDTVDVAYDILPSADAYAGSRDEWTVRCSSATVASASVASDGVVSVTPLAAGSCTVTVSYGGKSATITVKVKAATTS